jgi:hypothetical protein
MENSRGNTGSESAADKNVRLSNAADSAFNLLQKEWVQLSPYGDFPHAQGLQRVSFEAARNDGTQFRDGWARKRAGCLRARQCLLGIRMCRSLRINFRIAKRTAGSWRSKRGRMVCMGA